MITKKEQIELISKASGLSKTICEQVYDACGDVFVDILLSGNECRLFNLGTLSNSEIKEVPAKTVYNGLMKRDVDIPVQPKHNRPKFKFSTKISKTMKEQTLGNPFVK